MTDAEDIEARRRGYWLRRARTNKGITLGDAAVTAGLAASSGSTVSLWEHGARAIKVHQMKRLALRYGVPVSLFTNPPETDDERLRAAIAEATELALADSSGAGEPHPLTGGEPGLPRRKRQA